MVEGAVAVRIGAAAAVTLSGAAFALDLLRASPRIQRAALRRDPRARMGMVIQGIAFGLVALGFRGAGQAWAVDSFAVEATANVTAAVLVAGGVALFISSRRTLGRNWAFDARIRTGHELVTRGPYAFARHPIYVALLLALLGVSIVVAHWWIFPPAIVLYLAGTWIRIQIEERLLAQAFGSAWIQYAQRVGALGPRFARKRREPVRAS